MEERQTSVAASLIITSFDDSARKTSFALPLFASPVTGISQPPPPIIIHPIVTNINDPTRKISSISPLSKSPVATGIEEPKPSSPAPTVIELPTPLVPGHWPTPSIEASQPSPIAKLEVSGANTPERKSPSITWLAVGSIPNPVQPPRHLDPDYDGPEIEGSEGHETSRHGALMTLEDLGHRKVKEMVGSRHIERTRKLIGLSRQSAQSVPNMSTASKTKTMFFK
jgi:hypothetical protein